MKENSYDNEIFFGNFPPTYNENVNRFKHKSSFIFIFAKKNNIDS